MKELNKKNFFLNIYMTYMCKIKSNFENIDMFYLIYDKIVDIMLVYLNII